ncbi:hypothetical protein PFISCL1PPCAC_14511, partial [Pristionchus fissidentatus]
MEKRSVQSLRAIRRSLIVLFVQIVVPMSLLVLPSSIIFIGATIPNLIAFETSLICVHICFLHSIGHNLILLLINSTYR